MDAKFCNVEVDGITHKLPLRGRLFAETTDQKRPVAVGDRVGISLGDDGGAIHEVLPRESKLSRSSAGSGDREQVLAANISLVMVVASIVEPPFQTDLIDKTLAGAEREEIEAVIVLTKIDRDRRGRAEEIINIYKNVGYRVFATSIIEGHRTEDAIEQIGALLHQNRTILVGPSGAGKSSLINELVPGLDLKVGSLGRIRQGRHTTSHTQLIPLTGGGHVLDTPGIRNFGLFGARVEDIPLLFREIAQRAETCEFRNCTHLVEPGCSVRAALDCGEISQSRYDSYSMIIEHLRR